MRQNRQRFTSNLIDGQVLWQPGWFTPARFLVSRDQPSRLGHRCHVYPRSRPIHYQGKVKHDGRYWLIVNHDYLCVADQREQLIGIDHHPSWQTTVSTQEPIADRRSREGKPAKLFVAAEPLYFRSQPAWLALKENHQLLYTGNSIVYNRISKNGDFLYLETPSGFLPYRNQKSGHRYGILTDHRFQPPILETHSHIQLFNMQGQYRFSHRAVKMYQSPNLKAPVVGYLHRNTIVHYTGKLVDRHRGWLRVTHAGRHSYLPFKNRYPGYEVAYGEEVTGSAPVTTLREPWAFTHSQTRPIDLTTTAAEQCALARVTDQLHQVRQADSIVIGLINDTHYDAYQSSASQRTLHDMLMISHLAHQEQFDALVMNGDLVDGNQTLNRTLIDTADAVAALRESHVPTFITQGNHDDNSGFGRYLNGMRTEQVLNEETLKILRNTHFEDLLDTQHEFYGKYKVPGTPVSLILLNTFDIRDSRSDTYFDRNYDDQPNGIHWTGILQNIRHSRSRITTQQTNWLIRTLNALRSDEQALIITHDSLRSATDRQAVTPFWTYDWFANNQQGDYARAYHAITLHRDQIIAVMSAHTHVDDWSKQDGVNWITTTSDITDRRKSPLLDAHTIGAWDVLVINPKQRQLFRLRYGWQDRAGHLRNWRYRVFGDGTDTQHNTLAAFFNQFKRQPPLTGNGFYYQNQNKQVDQWWHGFKGYFKY